jgi:hypothetical protein
MENFEEEYQRIREIGFSHIIAEELSKKSYEFRDYYHKTSKRERNKKHYETNKARMSEVKKERYKAKKATETKPIVRQMPTIDVEAVDTTIKRQKADSKKIKELTESSIKTYTDAIKKTYGLYNVAGEADDSEIMKYLQGIKHNATKLYKQNRYIITNVRDIAEKHSYLIPQLYKLFSRFNTKKLKEFREVLFPYFTAYNENYTTHRNDLIVNEEEVAKISFKPEDLLKNAELIENVGMKILYLLMTLIPTRRISDYRMTKIAKNEEDLQNTNYNWYYNKQIYINNTKNNQKMVLDIPDELDAIIKTKTDSYLIDEIAQSTASHRFVEITKKIYGTPFTATDIRKIYATHNLKMGAEFRDITQMLKNQVAMGHILSEHLKYVLPNTSSN